ncbi:DUF459 domain-containing protein [Pseudenhygromyxa sp. WMMC2535]|uniref:DUF459 domain-containing protein n=1 Tax=Pseudenhygromyxa sp. WMMC2535 TaxID=2712867 RepID=UPI001553DA8F|nr:DUF459 domain-containing protein [Pseudenhygromyxa sp. WMMC2535]NVB36280.1 DUF459 domain-containing protein [Pseudenhygromyxa sp. WMMC2535]
MSESRDLSRRAVTLGLAGALASLAIPRRAHAGEHRALILGGSAIHGALGKQLERGMAALGHETLRDAKTSSGLARPDFFDWMERARELVAEFSPTVTIAMFGGNDAQGLWMGKDAEPRWIRWPEPGWSAEYRRRVEAFAEIVAPPIAGPKRRVVFLGMPAMKSDDFDERMARINELVAHAMAEHPRGYYLPTRGRLSEGYARRIERDGESVTIRAADGVHFSGAGAKLLAQVLVPHIDDKLS